jgi:hypothetical protein
VRRTPAILVIVALLASPLALLARGLACEPSVCICTCSGQHGHSSSPQLDAADLHRVAGGYCPACRTKLKHHPADYGFIAPVAPTAPLPVVAVPSPAVAREFAATFTQSPVAGFFSNPFEPPRA